MSETLEQQIIRLRTEEGLTHRKIAERLTTPSKEISRHLVRHVLDRVLGKSAPRGGVVFTKPAMRQLAKKADWPELIEQAKAEMLDDIRAEAREQSLAIVPAAPPSPSGILVEVSPVDLHVGKLSWGEETGVDYDVRIAERVFTRAIEDIASRVLHLNPERFVLVVGNDLTQTDSNANATTKGTVVDTDSRWVRSFRRATAINSWAIRTLAGIAPVTVVVVPGNHDATTAWTIGEVLAAKFADDPRVTVDNSPRPRKYVRWGINLIGYVHGHEEKHPSLPLIMAQERKLDWAETSWREFHTGHLHKSREVRFTAGDSFNGVRVRVLPALCGADAWHHAQGYVGEMRACEAYVFHVDRGYEGHLSSNVLDEAA